VATEQPKITGLHAHYAAQQICSNVIIALSVDVTNDKRCSASAATVHRPSWTVVCDSFTQLMVSLFNA